MVFLLQRVVQAFKSLFWPKDARFGTCIRTTYKLYEWLSTNLGFVSSALAVRVMAPIEEYRRQQKQNELQEANHLVHATVGAPLLCDGNLERGGNDALACKLAANSQTPGSLWTDDACEDDEPMLKSDEPVFEELYSRHGKRNGRRRQSCCSSVSCFRLQPVQLILVRQALRLPSALVWR
eukprot:4897200-Pleurochrysis_carterae.AAC.1